MYLVVYGDFDHGENIEIEGTFNTLEEAKKALVKSASKTFDTLNIDIESPVLEEGLPYGEIHNDHAWANSGGDDGYGMYWNIIEVDHRVKRPQ